jgi:transcriptional regulator with XRE-family HTH domain
MTGASGGSDPTIQRRLLGSRLRRLREQSRFSRKDAARVIRASESKISRLELGRLPFKERDVKDLLDLYGVDNPGVRNAHLAQAREAGAPGWWRTYSDVLPAWFELYVGLESAARLIRTYEAQFIPGLLQTEEYAHAITRAGHLPGALHDPASGGVERRVELRSIRQKILLRPEATRLWAIIDEGALRRRIGGGRVMQAQLEHLLQIQARPNVTIQIMPFGFGGHVAQVGAFTLLRFEDEDLPEVVYLEHLAGAIYLENREQTELYHQVFVQLAGDSQAPEESRAALHRILRDGWE